MANNAFRVVKLLDKQQLVINIGSNASVEVGQRYVIFKQGEEIVDPDTGESLGVLEIPKGHGSIIHVQERIALLKLETQKVAKTPSEIMSSLHGVEEPEEELSIELGDLARLKT